MTYYDSSALVKRYAPEEGREEVEASLTGLGRRVTCALTEIEVRRAIARAQSPVEVALARLQLTRDLDSFDIVGLDAQIVEPAAVIAELLGVRTLDAIHLAAAVRAGCKTVVSFDVRQRAAAITLGLSVYPPVEAA